MADISKVKVLDGTIYDIKDSTARAGMPTEEQKASWSDKYTQAEIDEMIGDIETLLAALR